MHVHAFVDIDKTSILDLTTFVGLAFALGSNDAHLRHRSRLPHIPPLTRHEASFARYDSQRRVRSE